MTLLVLLVEDRAQGVEQLLEADDRHRPERSSGPEWAIVDRTGRNSTTLEDPCRSPHPATLNNVDLGAVAALVETIRNQPDAAVTTWDAEVRWNDGFQSEARVREFAPVASDEPRALGGADTAPNPVEQLLGSLGNCLAVGYAANASVAGIAIRDLRIELSGDVDLHAFLGLREGHAGFDDIRVSVHLDADAPADELQALHDKVVGSSPVGHTLGRAIPVTVELA